MNKKIIITVGASVACGYLIYKWWKSHKSQNVFLCYLYIEYLL